MKILQQSTWKALIGAALASLVLIVVASGGIRLLLDGPDSHVTNAASPDGSFTAYEERDWSVASHVNTSLAYRNYLSLYPVGRHAAEARTRIERLRSAGRSPAGGMPASHVTSPPPKIRRRENPETRAPLSQADAAAEELLWSETRQANSIAAYEAFLLRFPRGTYAAAAERKHAVLSRIQSEWLSILGQNSVDAYRGFAEKYANFPGLHDAQGAVQGFDDVFWRSIVQRNLVNTYDIYIQLFPSGHHAEEAESLLIKFEVNKIFREQHQSIPLMARTESNEFVCPDRSKIVLKNNTPHTLTVLYSGPESKRITLYPEESTIFGIKNGKYRIAAEGRSGQLLQFAGEQVLDGGEYQSTYNTRR